MLRCSNCSAKSDARLNRFGWTVRCRTPNVVSSRRIRGLAAEGTLGQISPPSSSSQIDPVEPEPVPDLDFDQSLPDDFDP
jgi:hypothetical protein